LTPDKARNIRRAVEALRAYDGPPVRIMEVCGTHTSVILKSGIPSLIPPGIKLISGPGCPVCVTPAAYIDRLVGLGAEEGRVIYSFGDMLKVPGTGPSLSLAKAAGAQVRLMLSPLEAAAAAVREPEKSFVVSAVGFETTAPSFALLLDEITEKGIENIKLLTALKTTPAAIDYICANERGIDAFICPGHVSVVTGTAPFKALSEKYGRPFVVAGFEGGYIIAAVLEIIRQLKAGAPAMRNLYGSVVSDVGNAAALAAVYKYFEPADAFWRGIGAIKGSGLALRREYAHLDAGDTAPDTTDIGGDALPPGCGCGGVIMGRLNPDECPLFGTACLPEDPIGPCMVSAEGACGIWYRFKGKI